jgi:hypothetical protein
VDLVGGQAGRGRGLQPVGVIGRTVWQVPRAEIAFRLRLDLVDRRDQRGVAVQERPGQRGAGVGQQLCLLGICRL